MSIYLQRWLVLLLIFGIILVILYAVVAWVSSLKHWILERQFTWGPELLLNLGISRLLLLLLYDHLIFLCGIVDGAVLWHHRNASGGRCNSWLLRMLVLKLFLWHVCWEDLLVKQEIGAAFVLGPWWHHLVQAGEHVFILKVGPNIVKFVQLLLGQLRSSHHICFLQISRINIILVIIKLFYYF